MKTTVTYQHGGGYLLTSDGKSTLVSPDYAYPALAVSLGWSKASGACVHSDTDGSIDCPSCGKATEAFIHEATEYLDSLDGIELDVDVSDWISGESPVLDKTGDGKQAAPLKLFDSVIFTHPLFRGCKFGEIVRFDEDGTICVKTPEQNVLAYSCDPAISKVHKRRYEVQHENSDEPTYVVDKWQDVSEGGKTVLKIDCTYAPPAKRKELAKWYAFTLELINIGEITATD